MLIYILNFCESGSQNACYLSAYPEPILHDSTITDAVFVS